MSWRADLLEHEHELELVKVREVSFRFAGSSTGKSNKVHAGCRCTD